MPQVLVETLQWILSTFEIKLDFTPGDLLATHDYYIRDTAQRQNRP